MTTLTQIFHRGGFHVFFLPSGEKGSRLRTCFRILKNPSDWPALGRARRFSDIPVRSNPHSPAGSAGAQELNRPDGLYPDSLARNFLSLNFPRASPHLLMAGHNKWSKVKHIKAVVDAKKGRVFSKFAREITIAVKNGGRDPDANPRLRTALTGARAQNMPNDNIDRAIKTGSGELEGAVLEEITYEGYAPGGVAMLVECVTDNKNRASADVRITFNKNHGTMGSAGSVAHLFQRIGAVRVPAGAISEDTLTELAIEAGAEDVSADAEEDGHLVITAPDRLYAVANFLKENAVNAASIKLDYQPATTIILTDAETARQVLRLYEALDDLDDTQNVFANFEISDDIVQELDL